jgi:hypothetical protein
MIDKPHKVHVWIRGAGYCGSYDFATTEEADADMESRKGFEVLGCRYSRHRTGLPAAAPAPPPPPHTPNRTSSQD